LKKFLSERITVSDDDLLVLGVHAGLVLVLEEPEAERSPPRCPASP
jgi:hypothetical protein